MDDRLDALDFVRYAGSRWRIVAIACGVAVGLAFVAGLLLPKRYTATASVMIEPPAGADPRSATAVSPVYMDSLKTYERLASSDTLFAEALDHLKLRGKFAGRSTESLKRSVLQINRPVNTRIVEISATLDDPRDAQALAQYLAEQTVALNHSMEARTALDVGKDAAAVLAQATARLEAAQKAASGSGEESPLALSSEMQNAADLKYKAERDLGEAQADGAAGGTNARARIAELKAQAAGFDQTMRAKSTLLERLQRRRESLDNEGKAARANFELARAKVDEIRTSSAFRSERLNVLDPGIVPQRPSYPNTPLNVMLAFLSAFSLSFVWLAMRFGYERAQIAQAAERVYNLR